MPRFCVFPNFSDEDKADGGIRRVVEAQLEWLPQLGWEVTSDPAQADVLACHAIVPHAPILRSRQNVLVSHNHGLYWTEYDWQPWTVGVNSDVVEALDRSDHMTAPTEWVANILRRGWLRDVTVLNHGVNMSDWPEGVASEGYVLWNKTRVDAVCDPGALVQLARLAPSVPFVSTFGIEGLPNLKTAPPVSWAEHKGLVQRAGVYLCTARETFGIGTIEAMAAGVPILGWDWGGQHEIVTHGEDGWLCRPGDYESLVAGLEWCLANKAKVGKAARAKVSGKYTWRIAMERYANLYAQLLESSPGLHSQTNPRVSVVIPCYKLERYLEGAVKSAIAMDKTLGEGSVEIVVVDDCSPGDGSPRSAKDIAQELGVGYLRTPENLYLAGALNYVIERATAPIIIALDADNELGTAAHVLVEAIERDRGVDIAYGAMEVAELDEAGNEVRRYHSDWPHDFVFQRQIMGRNQIPSTAAFRKDVWKRIGGYRRRCKTADDADFWCRATSFGGRAVKVTSGNTLFYRDRTDSMSHTVPLWPFQEWYAWSRKSALSPLGVQLDEAGRKAFLKFPTHEPVLVSIIVPVGPGHARYLPDAIDSVLSQTMSKWELIIVNDSGEALEWMPPIARYLETPTPGSGPAVARNMGLDVAQGRAFMFLDADDYLQHAALEYMYEAWHTSATEHNWFVFGDYVEQPGGSIHASPDYAPDMFLRTSPIPIAIMGPMAQVKKGLRFDTELDAWEDWDFFLQMCERGVCGTHVTVPTYNYRITTGKRREALYEQRDTLKQALMGKWGPYLLKEKAMACGACGASNWKVPAMPTLMGAVAPGKGGTVSDSVLLEYVGPGGNPTFTGPVSNTPYRFGTDAGHKVRYVTKEDAAVMLERWPQTFKLYNGELAALAAAPMVSA